MALVLLEPRKRRDPLLCSKNATIVRRLCSLFGLAAVATPLAIFQRPDQTVALITSFKLEATLRSAALYVYAIDPISHRTEPQQWSSHFYRVEACVILLSMGYTPTQIEFLFRWRSEAFMVYLRNLPCLVQYHARAVDEMFVMPHIFKGCNRALAECRPGLPCALLFFVSFS